MYFQSRGNLSTQSGISTARPLTAVQGAGYSSTKTTTSSDTINQHLNRSSASSFLESKSIDLYEFLTILFYLTVE